MRRSPALAAAVLLAATPAARADWHTDAPGRSYHIAPDALPPPYATPSTADSPAHAARPPGARRSP